MLNPCPSEIGGHQLIITKEESTMSFRQRLALAVYSAAKKNAETFPYGIDAYVSTLVSLGE